MSFIFKCMLQQENTKHITKKYYQLIQKCLPLLTAMIQEAQEQRHYNFINTKAIEKKEKIIISVQN